MDSYEINKDTCAIVSVDKSLSKIIEKNDDYFVNKSCYQVMEDSCQYYGSTCDGRIQGTKQILGSGYKVPIVVEESNDLIFFPTEAHKSSKCVWLSLNHINKYENCNGFTRVTFDSGKTLIIKMSVASFEMQVLRANRLGSIIRKRRGG